MKRAINIIQVLTTTMTMGSVIMPAATWTAEETIPCDPATGCIPSAPPPPAPTPSAPSSTPPPSAAPAPVGDIPGKVRIGAITVRKGDQDSINANGFAVRFKWGGGLRASSFLVRLQKVSFQPLGPGDSATKQGQFFKLKPGDWMDTQRVKPKTWNFSVPRATEFYRVQVRGINSLGPGPVAERYLLVAKHNEGTLVFT